MRAAAEWPVPARGVLPQLTKAVISQLRPTDIACPRIGPSRGPVVYTSRTRTLTRPVAPILFRGGLAARFDSLARRRMSLPARSAILTMSAFAFATSGLAQQPAGTLPLRYPPSARGEVVDTLHGTAVADPYRWLENTDAPETRAWIDAQNALTFGYLETLPQRA